jgi:pimeloyl-ACP methyl ester carboxylesterase
VKDQYSTAQQWQLPSALTVATDQAGPGGAVTLRDFGSSSAQRTVVVLPGMEGSGESCMEIVLGVVRLLGGAYRVILIDYSLERCASLDDLSRAIHRALFAVFKPLQIGVTLWGQSFGNLLAMSIQALGGIRFERVIQVSPFTRIPKWKLAPGTIIMKLAPTSAYRRTIIPVGRCIFGPVGDRPDHPFFYAMQSADAPTMARRMQWLLHRDFSQLFAQNIGFTRVYFGARDRLLDLAEQKCWFVDLNKALGNHHVAEIIGGGHVIVPSAAAADAIATIAGNWDN